MSHDDPTNYPLDWPAGKERTPASRRNRAAFGRNVKSEGYNWTTKKPLTVSQALERLMGELNRMTGRGHTWRVPKTSIVVSTNIRTRNDGLPYSNAAEPADPGVAVYFKLDGEPHCLPCDAWDRVADNITAIAKHIEAMRGMERWGVGDLRTAFAGFKSLPPGGGSTSSPAFTIFSAARFLVGCFNSGASDDSVLADHDTYRSVYRRASTKLHPDQGGDADQFKLLQEAKRVLDQHHNK